MRALPLSEKLVLYFVFLGILVIIAVAPFSYYRARQALLNRTFDQLTSVRVMKTQQLEAFFEDRMRESRQWMRLEVVREILRHYADNELNPQTIQLLHQQLRQKPLPSADYIREIFFFYQGQPFLSLDMQEDSLIFTHLPLEGPPGTGVFLKDYSSLPGNGQRLLCYAGLSDGSGIALGISPESIDRMMLENDPLSGLGYSGESYLVGPDMLMRSSSRFQESAILKTLVQTTAVEAALSGREGTAIIDDYRGVEVLSAFAPAEIPGLDWVILAELDLEETIAPLKALRDSLIGISILISLVMFVIAWFTARRISRPLRRFGEAVEEMSRGNLLVNVQHRGKDEVGKLAESFNRMAEQLRANQESLNAEQLRQVELTLDGQEKERRRLSRELHDGLGQHLIAVKLKLEQITPENTCDAFKGIREVRQAIDHTIDEIRNISNDLMPSSLEAFGLGNALRKLSQDTAQDAGIEVHTHLDKPALKPGSQASLYLYRIAQEALHNIVKHAGAAKVWLSLIAEERHIILEVKDNGIGIDESSPGMGQGQGLTNIRERTRILKGEMYLHRMTEGGTLLRIKIPADES